MRSRPWVIGGIGVRSGPLPSGSFDRTPPLSYKSSDIPIRSLPDLALCLLVARIRCPATRGRCTSNNKTAAGSSNSAATSRHRMPAVGGRTREQTAADRPLMFAWAPCFPVRYPGAIGRPRGRSLRSGKHRATLAGRPLQCARPDSTSSRTAAGSSSSATTRMKYRMVCLPSSVARFEISKAKIESVQNGYRGHRHGDAVDGMAKAAKKKAPRVRG